MVRTVKLCSQRALSNRQAYGISQTLTQWAGGGFNARRITDLRVAWGLRVQLTEIFQLFNRQVITAEVQQAIKQHGAVAVREDEAVTIKPGGIGRIMLEEVAPQHFGDIGHTHRRTGVA